ncbi:MAG TPA: hypothetical protein VI338_03665 [Nitrososphaera sp.]|nr:hypothetical protein [Nitrososphaera sp.]
MNVYGYAISVLTLEIVAEFTVLHELYVISFSIFYAVMLHTIRGIRAFDTSSAFTGGAKPLRRFILSIIVLNFLPFIYFSVILLYLLQFLEVSILSILVVFGLSIGIFGFDKIFHAFLVRYKSSFYTSGEMESILGNGNGQNIARKFSCHYLQYLIPGVLYIVVPLGFLLVEFDAIMGISTIVGSALAGFAIWHYWRRTIEPHKSQPVKVP